MNEWNWTKTPLRCLKYVLLTPQTTSSRASPAPDSDAEVMKCSSLFMRLCVLICGLVVWTDVSLARPVLMFRLWCWQCCVVLTPFTAVYFLLWALYGFGHWTGAPSGRDCSLLSNTNDCLLSAICFLHLHSTLPLSLFLFHSVCHPILNSLSVLPCKAIIPSLLPHVQHTLRLSAPLSSPRRTRSLSLSVFFNGGFCPFHLLENKGFLWMQDRRKEMDGESDREEEILTLSVSEQWVEKVILQERESQWLDQLYWYWHASSQCWDLISSQERFTRCSKCEKLPYSNNNLHFYRHLHCGGRALG